MAHRFTHEIRSACYRSGSRLAILLGLGLIVTGIILLVWCVPLWAYLALIGVALIVLGIFLIHK